MRRWNESFDSIFKTLYRPHLPWRQYQILRLPDGLAIALDFGVYHRFCDSHEHICDFCLGGAMVVCSIIAVVTNIIANRMASSVARDTTGSIRHDLFEKFPHLSIPQVEEVGIPSLVSRLTTDTYNIHQTVGMIQRMGIRAPILLLGGS